MSVYLALALLPTPLVVSWFLTRPTPASATVEEKTTPPRVFSLTDLAPPQPRLVADPAESPKARLARLGIEPAVSLPSGDPPSPADLGLEPPSSEDPREAQLATLTAQLGGDRKRAEKLMVQLESRIAPTPQLFAPRRAPPVPDPFVPLPARPQYKRTPR